MEEMVFVGYQYGSFKPDGRSERVPFASVFFLQQFPDVPSDSDFHADGLKSAKFKLASADVVENAEVALLDVCEVYFNSKGVVTKIATTGKNLSTVSAAVAAEEASGV